MRGIIPDSDRTNGQHLAVRVSSAKRLNSRDFRLGEGRVSRGGYAGNDRGALSRGLPSHRPDAPLRRVKLSGSKTTPTPSIQRGAAVPLVKPTASAARCPKGFGNAPT